MSSVRLSIAEVDAPPRSRSIVHVIDPMLAVDGLPGLAGLARSRRPLPSM